MRILLDEFMPEPMKQALGKHESQTVRDCGWGGIRNGELLDRAEGDFDLFITADQNLQYQQNLSGRRVAILEVSTNNLRRILAAEASLLSAIDQVAAGKFHQLRIP